LPGEFSAGKEKEMGRGRGRCYRPKKQTENKKIANSCSLKHLFDISKAEFNGSQKKGEKEREVSILPERGC